MVSIQKDVNNFNFKINAGILGIDFTFTPDRVINALGTPLHEEYFEDGEILFEYTLKDNHIFLFFHYDNSPFDYLSIHLKKLIILEHNIYELNKFELIDILRKYHLHNDVYFKMDISSDEDEEIIAFPNIGLTAWFENSEISDICIEPVFDDSDNVSDLVLQK